MPAQHAETTREPHAAPPAGRRERKKQETRDKLHRAAFDLFLEQGYGSTRISQITEAADVSECTFFRYFESKEGVALDAVRRLAQATVEAVCARPAHESPVEACLALTAGSAPAGLRPSPAVIASLALISSTPELIPRAIAMGDRFLNLMAADVARRLGEPVGSLRVRIQAHALNVVSKAAMDVWLADPEGEDIQAVAREALLELQRGL